MWRNKSLLQQSFFVERFSGEYLQLASGCQIKLACQSNQILQLGVGIFFWPLNERFGAWMRFFLNILHLRALKCSQASCHSWGGMSSMRSPGPCPTAIHLLWPAFQVRCRPSCDLCGWLPTAIFTTSFSRRWTTATKPLWPQSTSSKATWPYFAHKLFTYGNFHGHRSWSVMRH